MISLMRDQHIFRKCLFSINTVHGVSGVYFHSTYGGKKRTLGAGIQGRGAVARSDW